MLKGMREGREILAQANLYLRGVEKQKTAANALLRYFRSAHRSTNSLGAESLAAYKSELAAQRTSGANTKNQVFSYARGFVTRLIERGVLVQQSLPKNFKTIEVNSHQSFSEIAGGDVGVALADRQDQVEEVLRDGRLDHASAQVLVFNRSIVDQIHACAIEGLREKLDDCDLVGKITSGMDEEERKRLSGILDFNAEFGDTRTEEFAFVVLYANHGAKLPVTEKWVPGVYDFFKTRGLLASDVRRRFESHLRQTRAFWAKATPVERKRLRSVSDWRLRATDGRSVELAIKILFSHFGHRLPASAKWPKGLMDYLKARAWAPLRLASAFFPGPVLHQHLMMMLLSHTELAPNVSSVVQHSTIEAVLPGSYSGVLSVHLGKKRGAPVLEDVSDKDEGLGLVRRYQKILRVGLEASDEGRGWLGKEECPLFLHYGRRGSLKKYEEDDAVEMAKRSFRKYAEIAPLISFVAGRATGVNFRPSIVAVMALEGVPVGKIKKKLHHGRFATTTSYVDRVQTSVRKRGRQLDFQQMLLDEVSSVSAGRSCAKSEKVSDQGGAEVSSSLVLLADDRAVALWIAWCKEIGASEQRMRIENPERWLGYWQVRLMEYQAFLVKVPSSQKRRAEHIASSIVLPRIE
ncbi:hypothetical protein [Pseudoxanthomonas mexicana]|uniref:hypothetical protein n=1 Tax=Pseudoxanthomonas mexicana TaxID=128785 RepID=UPI0028A9F8F2|nr:hypothetical protein [Pseudoxanthomonas mexicana]